eukprot:5151825-Prymnesium_polylepis.1
MVEARHPQVVVIPCRLHIGTVIAHLLEDKIVWIYRLACDAETIEVLGLEVIAVDRRHLLRLAVGTEQPIDMEADALERLIRPLTDVDCRVALWLTRDQANEHLLYLERRHAVRVDAKEAHPVFRPQIARD